MGDSDKIHKYGTEFSMRWNLAITMGNNIAEEDAGMVYFMGLNDGYKDLKTQKLNGWARVPADTIATVAGMKALASTWVLPGDVEAAQMDLGAFALGETPPTGKGKKNRGRGGRGHSKSEPEGTQAYGNQDGSKQQGRGGRNGGRGRGSGRGRGRGGGRDNASRGGGETRACHNCGEVGHIKANCPNPPVQEGSSGRNYPAIAYGQYQAGP